MTVRTRSLLLVAGVPVLVTVVAVLAVLFWPGDLPDALVTGESRTGSLHTMTAVFAVTTLLFSGLLSAFLLRATHVDHLVRALLAAVSVWQAVYLGVVLVGTVAVQSGGARTESVDGVLIVAFVLAIAVAAAAWFLTPHDDPRPPASSLPADASRIELADDETAVWTRTASSRVGVAVTTVGFMVCVVVSAITGTWFPLMIGLVVLVLVGSQMTWRITVDRRGLTATPLLGFPTVTAPLAEIDYAEATTVGALREFGGFGLRLGRKGRTGIALRSGVALEVHRTENRPLVITVDDPETAAQLLNGQIARSGRS
ncbi:hypothetical protein GCM10007304_01790 [Rhodococcoides trifolii]|uniref:DUF1648 domain-containing protein n=1 Tax=Rhodococcoides trifolii TaxID=908250 RepID=A0A917CMU2_9NOCA|nr:hypothetical protein [Rhodococcus trifolii]GGF91498.1 hypothetical protein GCM10007304_01790 [Rhodococcus trifolii]